MLSMALHLRDQEMSLRNIQPQDIRGIGAAAAYLVVVGSTPARIDIDTA